MEFYNELLGFETWKLDSFREEKRTSFFFRLGENALLKIRPKTDFQRPEGKKYDHFCITINKDIDELEEELENKGYNVLRRGNPLGTQGRAPAVYVEDPFGYVIELKKSK